LGAILITYGVNETWVQDFTFGNHQQIKNKIDAHVFSHARVIEY
jgi:hypothetical protein